MTTAQPNHTTHEQASEPEVPPALKPPSSTLGAWVLLLLAFGLYVVSQFFLTKLGIIWGTAVGQILFLLLPAILFARWKTSSMKEALRLRPVTGAIWWRVTLLALTGVGASILLGHLTEPWVARYFADWIPMLEFMEQLLTPKTASGLVSNLVVIGLVAPVCEEVLFRGAFQGSLEQRGPVRAIAWTALVFACIHINPFNFIGPILYGVGLGLVVWRTGSILPAILWHALNNSVVVLLAAHFGQVDSIPSWGVWVCGGLTILFGVLLWEFIRHTRTCAPAPSPLATAPPILRRRTVLVILAGSCASVVLLLVAAIACFDLHIIKDDAFLPDYANRDMVFITGAPLRPFIQIQANDIVLCKHARTKTHQSRVSIIDGEQVTKQVTTKTVEWVTVTLSRVSIIDGEQVTVLVQPEIGASYEVRVKPSDILGKIVWKHDPGKENKEMQRQIEAKILKRLPTDMQRRIEANMQRASKSEGTGNAEISIPKSQTLIVTDLGRPAVVNLLADPKQHMPVVELTVNGRPARFLLDTGSSVDCVFGNPQEKWGIPFEDKSDGEYIWSYERGRWAKYIGHVESVTFGIGDGTTVRVENLHVRSPLSESEVTVATFDGLLSGAFLKAIGGVIDLGGGTLRIEGRPTAPGCQSDGKNKPTEPPIEEQ
jgi:membrane protease YdiL (CAAX protease family)